MKFIKTLVGDVLTLVLGVALIPLFLLVALPIWVVIRVTGWGRTAKVSRQDVVRHIDDFLAGTGDEWDWDDFTSIPIEDPELEAVRERCAAAPEIWPPIEPNQYCSPEGLAELQTMADRLREPLLNDPPQRTTN